MERVMGIEPTYSDWQPDVLPLYYTRIFGFTLPLRGRASRPLTSLRFYSLETENLFCAVEWNRTIDPSFFRALLYH